MVTIDKECPAKKFFETNGGITVNLEDVLLCLCDSKSKFSALSTSFSVKDFLQKILDGTHDEIN